MSAATPSGLPVLPPGGAPVACDGTQAIARGTFLAEVTALAERLPARPYVVNFCSNRYRFTVGWIAAMVRGQVTLLPASRDAQAVAALRADYPDLYVLTDDERERWPAPSFVCRPNGVVGHETRVPAFPADQVAAVLFTSGSTGRPNPNARAWGRLVAASRAAGAALRIAQHAGAAVIATVPHGHSFGLESAVMLPLQHGLLLTATRPFFPADIAAALNVGQRPGILVTTPVHLRALVGDAVVEATTGPPRGVCNATFILSATAPLAADLAGRAERAFAAPVYEIYGCSEAGQLATRRTVDGPIWRCLDGFRLYRGPAGCWAAGPVEPDALLADEIELAGEGLFVLKGRTADLVNVAGKRSSLAHLTQQLLAIEGVQDGVFLMPDAVAAGIPNAVGIQDAPSTTPRLAAVVIAPGLCAHEILVRLRERIDPAFLPRPLRVVDALPRNELGKLPRSDLLRLIAGTPNPPAEVAPIILQIPADHPTALGHFPGNPIVPGAVMLDELIAMLCPDGWTGVLQGAKFHAPVRPGDTISVVQRPDGPSTRFECRLSTTRQLVLSGILRTSFATS